MKGIKREFSVSRTPQQNRLAERKNRTLIEAAKTMLADLLLPTTFWAEAVSTACYIQNRVLATKPHNKTPYELLIGRTPNLDFMKAFGCHVTILKTLDHLGKFEGKVDEGFLVEYYVNSNAFRVFNSRTRRVEENLHINDADETSMNMLSSYYCWVISETVTSVNETETSTSKTSKESMEKPKTVRPSAFIIEDWRVKENLHIKFLENKPNVARRGPKWLFDIDSLTNSMNYKPVTVGNQTNNDACIEMNTNARKVKQEKASDHEYILLPFMPSSTQSLDDKDAGDEPDKGDEETGIFDDVYDDREVGVEADTNNLELSTVVSPIPTTRVHKDHPKKQIIGDLNLANQTRRMLNFSKENARVLWIQNQMLDYRFNPMNIKIYIDNESTICIVKKLVFYSKTKHLKIRHHFIRDSYKKKLIQVIKIHTDYNVADLLTKAFDVGRFNFLTATVRAVDNGEQQIIATVDGKEFTITDASVKRHLQLVDTD
nr:retrovirus-related Pol polyprotein from transposon TNT 1-94 [Tanacetum cinerariifolium]